MTARTRLAISILCSNPATVIQSIPAGDDRAYVGTIFGRADDLSSRANPAGDGLIIGLVGKFESVRADGGEPDTANACNLPQVTQTPIQEMLYEPDMSKRRAGVIAFAYDVWLIKAKNGGHTFQLAEAIKPVADDPLKDMRATLIKRMEDAAKAQKAAAKK